VVSGSNGDTAKAGLKAVGKAGVAAADWTQTIEGSAPSPKYVAEITGGMETTDTTEGCHESWEINYNGKLSDSFTTTPGAGFYLPRSGGLPQTGARAYDETGSGTFTLDPCEDDPGCSAGLRKYSRSDPGHLTLTLVGSDTIRVRGNSFTFENDGSNDDCSGDPPVGVGTLGEGTFPTSMAGQQTITVPLSHDDTFSGRHAVGSATVTLTRVS
jgi:hypothetical protein